MSGVPAVLQHHVERIRALPETVLLLTLQTTHVPYEDDGEMKFEELGKGFARLTVRRGFMDTPHVPNALKLAIATFASSRST